MVFFLRWKNEFIKYFDNLFQGEQLPNAQSEEMSKWFEHMPTLSEGQIQQLTTKVIQ